MAFAERLRSKDQCAPIRFTRYRGDNQENPMGEANPHLDFASSAQTERRRNRMSVRRLLRVSRRGFLRQTGGALVAAGSAPVISAPFVSSALADTKSLSIVQWSHFVPAYDKWFDQFVRDWGEKNKISVTVDHIPVQ